MVSGGGEPPNDRPGPASAVLGHTPVRGTQSFVHTLSECWRRPSLTALEVLWRWAYGVPAAAVVAYEAMLVVKRTPIDVSSLERMSLTDPLGASATIAEAAGLLLPPALHVARWLAPVLAVAWVILSAAGRTAVLRRVDAELHSRPATLMFLQLVRTAGLAGVVALWFLSLRWAAGVAVGGPIEAGREPNLVLYCAVAIVATLGLFTFWAVVSWVLSVAPLLAMRLNLGVSASLAAAIRLATPVRAKLIEINLVMGIVKIALIVLAMVLSATPLPFEGVATPEFMVWWYAGVTILYLVASDFFHIAHLVGYLELWKSGAVAQ